MLNKILNARHTAKYQPRIDMPSQDRWYEQILPRTDMRVLDAILIVTVPSGFIGTLWGMAAIVWAL